MFSLVRKWWQNLGPTEMFGIFRTDLSSLMASARTANTLAQKIQWLEDLLDWIRIPTAPESGRIVSQIQAVRVRFFLQTLERNPDWKKSVSRLIRSVLLETEAVRLLCESGLNTGDGFFSEATERLIHRLLPSPRNERDLSQLFSRIFSEESDADWLQKIDEPTLRPLLALLFEDPNTAQLLARHYRLAVSEAMIILASHLESLGLSSEIRLRSQVLSVRESAFYRLRMAVSAALETGTSSDFRPLFASCREEINSAFAHLEEHGVSVSIVYRLEKMERHLSRMENLMAVHFAEAPTAAWMNLLADLVSSRLQGDKVGALIQHNMHMLARKIVERTGASGEHYITSSRKEYFAMLRSAGGGGVLTAGTAYLKYVIGHAHPAMFFEGLFSWLNYSGSFTLMQAFHFTLATKQPSMTAPALAAKLKESQSMGAFTDLVARITRSQFAAALGNIGMVVPVSVAADYFYFRASGTHLLPADYAAGVVRSLHPWKSATIPYAALTGIILWVSSIGAGWAENWFVYRRLPETVTQSAWLQRIFGEKRAAKISGWICKNVSGIGGNISLGFLLAFTPVAGRFFGLPLDVRHVTLSAGALTFAFCALPEVSAKDIALGATSVLLIGLMNFGVSFAAALFTAVKARNVKRARLALVRRALWQKSRKNLLDFFYPWSKDSQGL